MKWFKKFFGACDGTEYKPVQFESRAKKWLATFKLGDEKGRIEPLADKHDNDGLAFIVVRFVDFQKAVTDGNHLADAIELSLLTLNMKQPDVLRARNLLSAAITKHIVESIR